jgi:hypothetical protein
MSRKLKMIFGPALKSLHQWWLQGIGGVFLALAFVFGWYAVEEYWKASASEDGGIYMLLSAVGLSLLTLGFGIHSFWKARKLR